MMDKETALFNIRLIDELQGLCSEMQMPPAGREVVIERVIELLDDVKAYVRLSRPMDAEEIPTDKAVPVGGGAYAIRG